MIQSSKLLTGLIVSSLAALMMVGCASGQPMAQSQPRAQTPSMSQTQPLSLIGSGDVVADRQRLMKLNGASWRDIQAKAKAGDIEAIAVNAEMMAIGALHIPSLFPEGSLTEESNAKPEIWQQRDEFEKQAQNFRVMAEQLRDTAQAKDADATQAMVKTFGKQACGACHTPFRVPPPR